MAVRSYIVASAALGAIATWSSENLFWSAPPDGWTPLEFAMTWMAYSVCAAAALSAVLATGVRGWPAVLLGGALLGWLVEGVVAGTMYEAFPFQLVWTPLAWHALVSGVLVLGIGRLAGRWPLRRVLGAWVLVGLLGGLWAAYWPRERDVLPGGLTVAGYLIGVGLLVPLAQVVLDRLGRVPVPSRTLPSRAVLLVAPTLLLVAWLFRLAAAPRPVMLSLPCLLVLTIWIMRRLGVSGRPGIELGPPGTPGRHGVFLVAPAVATVVAALLWTAAPGGLPIEGLVAGALCLVSLGLYLRAGWGARRRRGGPDRVAVAMSGQVPGTID